MKVINDFGSRFSGTVGKQMTASTWKGRNYLKKYTKPANPNTINQQRVRGYFAAAVALWKTLAADQKSAYGDKTRADKTNISPFNTMISSYAKLKNAGLVYAAPEVGEWIVKDSLTTDPIEGVLLTVKKTGQTTEYQTATTEDTGIVKGAICVEDQNYDLTFSATGYISQTKEDFPANYIWRPNHTISLVAEE